MLLGIVLAYNFVFRRGGMQCITLLALLYISLSSYSPKCYCGTCLVAAQLGLGISISLLCKAFKTYWKVHWFLSFKVKLASWMKCKENQNCVAHKHAYNSNSTFRIKLVMPLS